MTGASGFIGRSLFEMLRTKYSVSLILRTSTEDFAHAEEKFILGSFSKKTDFSVCLNEVDCVIHLAAKAHITNKPLVNSICDLKDSNTDATLKLAKQSAESGVRRFIFLSTIGVNGKNNESPFTSSDEPNPSDAYSVSKYEAEIGLRKIAENTGMEVVIIRAPLVYGKNAPGSFGALLNLSKKQWPLPLGAINNKRSFVSVDNLTDLIITCIEHPQALNKTFLVSDGENISTSNLLRMLRLASGKHPKLIPVPISFLKIAASILGKKNEVEKLSCSLTIDIEYTMTTLNWKPPITLDDGIRRCLK